MKSEEQIRKELEPFREHQKSCKDCALFPIRPACYEGAKLANPQLTLTEDEYWARIADSHSDCCSLGE